MADLSQVELNGTTYDLKDLTIRRAHGLDPIATKTYTNVIATANDNNGAGFFYLKVRADAYTTAWHVKTRVKATVPGNVNYNTDTIFDIWGHTNTYSWYACLNRIRSTSYRPIYYNSLFRLNETGYNNGCANWVGFSLVGATNNTSSSYKRQVIVELLEYEGCTVELQDSLITPTNIPERAAHTNWYTSTNTSFDNFDACSYGLKQSGDANTTDIVNLTFANGTYIADSAVYRNQLLFQKDENTLTPLNNNDNTTGTSKTMLTTVEFNPFGRIAYYNSTTNISAGGSIGASPLFWSRSNVDLRYTFNCGTTLTAQKPFYLVVTPTSNGLCKIASTTPWSQTLPTSNDGKWYILLGRTYSTYQMALYAYHPVYYHDGLKVKMLVEPEPSTNSVMTLDTSGDIATFNHASTDVPLKSLVVDIEPNQAGSGDPSPTNVRPISGWTGLSSLRDRKNLFDPTANPNKWIATNGLIAGTAGAIVSPQIPCAAGDTFTVSLDEGTGTLAVAFYDTSGTLLDRSAQGSTNSKTATAPANTAYMYAGRYKDSSANVQLEKGSTATAYVPYVNERSGYVNITGKNLLPNKTYQRGTNYVYLGQDVNHNYFPIHLKAGTYTLACNNTVTASLNYMISGGSTVQIHSSRLNNYDKFTIDKDGDYQFWLYNGSGITPNDVSEFQLEIGESKTSYEPYIIGENLLDQVEWTAGPIMSDGSIGTDTNFQHSPVMSVKPGETYILTYGIGRTGNRRVHGYINGTWKQQITYKDYSATGGRDSLTFTIPSGINGLAVSLSNLDSYVRLELVDPVSVTWSDVGGTGKNLINQDDTNTSNGYVHSAYLNAYDGGVSSASGTWDVMEYALVKPNTTYTLSGTTVNSSNGWAEYDSNKVKVNNGTATVTPFTFTTGSSTRYVRFNRNYATDTKVQLEEGSMASSYAPYYVGTVYGAKVDLVSGVLTVDTAVETENGGNQYWQLNTGGVGRFYLPFLPSDLDTSRKAESICNVLTYKDDNTVYGSFFVYGGSGLYVNKISASETLEEFKTRISNPALQIIYPLAHPRTYQLTHQQIHALKGNNVIYTNCGPVKVEYYTESMIQATDSYAGLMSAVDKRKLDTLSGIAISETEPTNDGVLAWIDPDASDTIGILSETEINSQYVSHDHAQTLTSAQQNRALQNIGISDGTDTQKTNLATFAGISLTVVGTI